MEHEDLGLSGHIFDCILGGSIVVMCSDATQPNGLFVLLKLQSEVFGCADPIVSVAALDNIANGQTLPLKGDL